MYPLQVVCFSGDVITRPDDAPRAIMWDNSGIIESVRMPICDKRNTAGRFRHFINLDGKYSAGHHWVQYMYQISSTVRSKIESFQILGGGNVSGSGISMEYFGRPPNAYVLVQTDGGVLVRRKNPQVTQ